MVFSSCFTCFKYSVFFFNFLLWLLGCALLTVGGWLLTEDDGGRYVEKVTSTSTDLQSPLVISYSEVTDTNLATPLAYLFLVFGTMLVLVVIIGCCGAVRDNLCLLITFAILLSMVFVVLLGVGMWSFTASKKVDVHTTRLQHLTNDTLRKGARNYYTQEESRDFMEAVQSRFNCCGADNGFSDYGGQWPCQAAYRQEPCLPVYFNYVANHFEKFVRKRLVLVAGLSTAFAICLAVHVVLVLLLSCAVREKTRAVRV